MSIIYNILKCDSWYHITEALKTIRQLLLTFTLIEMCYKVHLLALTKGLCFFLSSEVFDLSVSSLKKLFLFLHEYVVKHMSLNWYTIPLLFCNTLHFDKSQKNGKSFTVTSTEANYLLHSKTCTKCNVNKIRFWIDYGK